MRINKQQWKVLKLCLDVGDLERLRAVWLDGNGLVLGTVADPFAYHPSAEWVKVYRLAVGGDEALQGDAIGRTNLTVADLRALEPCWGVPLRSLSPLGRQLASGPPEPPVVATFKAPRELDYWLTQKSQVLARTRTDLIIQAITEWRSRNP